MKFKTLAILLITFGILLAVVLFISRPQKAADHQAAMGASLLPGLAAGDIATITITSPEATARLRQTPTGWSVATRFNYPADFSKISGLVQKIAGAKIGRAFPATPEIQARLALYPPEQKDLPADRKGTRIVLADKAARTLADLIVGKSREDSPGAASATCYVMLPPESRVYLIDQDFRFLEKKAAGWLNNRPIDLDPKKIHKVICFDLKKKRPVYTLERPAGDKEPILLGLPAGKKMAKSKTDQLFEALTSLSVEDIADPSLTDSAAVFSGAPHFDYHLYDGTVYHIFPGPALKDNSENHYFRATVSFQPPPGKADPAQKENQAKLAADAEKLNLKLSPWTYVIARWVYDSFPANPRSFIEKENRK